MIDRESLKEMSPQDLIDAMSTAENGVGQFKVSLEEQAEQLSEVFDVEDEFSQVEISLLESLEEVQSFDPDVYLSIMETIIESIKSKKLKPEDIPKLILNFGIASEANREMLERYGSAQGAMTWSNFRIILHDSLKEQDEEENPKYNIGHHLNHEIGHSITEIDAISQEEIEEIFTGIGTKFESAHIQRLISNAAPDDLVLKERFAECVGIYLRSDSPEEFIENRGQNSANEVDDDFESEEAQKEFIDESQQLYDRMGKIWPSIQTRLGKTELSEQINQVLGETDENLAPFGESQLQTAEEAEPQTAVSAPDSGSDGKKEPAISKANYQESPELAKNQKHTESFNQVVKSLIKGFSEGVDVFQGAK